MHDYCTDIIIIYDYYCIYYGTIFCSCFFTAIVCVASVPTDYKCGYLPRELTLKRGERQTLIFWNDRLYDQPPQNEDNLETAKGQLILKGLFGVFNSSKNRTKKKLTRGIIVL